MAYLDNKTAVVTGAGQGIGRAIALELARAGADVVVTDIDTQKAEAVTAEISALGRQSMALHLDVTCADSATHCIEKILTVFPRIDCLINNAGYAQKSLFLETSNEDFERCNSVNLNSIWRLSKMFASHFKVNEGGKIVNIASIAGRRGLDALPAYSASKAAVISLTQSLATLLGPDNINVNAVCPGSIWTKLFKDFLEKASEPSDRGPFAVTEESFLAGTGMPLGRQITPEDIGHAVVFLVADQAKNITGQSLNVDGGLTMS